MDGLKKVFNWAAKGAAVIALTEILVFTLVHSNPAWMAVMYGITPTINALFDTTGVTSAGWWLAGKLGAGVQQTAAALGGAAATTSGGISAFVPGFVQ